MRQERQRRQQRQAEHLGDGDERPGGRCRQRHERHRLAERIGQVRVPDHQERQRREIEQHGGRGAGQPVAPRAHDSPVEQRSGHRVGGADDDAEEHHVVVREERPRRREGIQSDGVGKAHAVGKRLCEIEAAREHPLEAVRVEDRVDEPLGRVKQRQQLQEERAGRDGDDAARHGVYPAVPEGFDSTDAGRRHDRNPDRHRRGPRRVAAINRGAHRERDRLPDGDDRSAGEREHRAEAHQHERCGQRGARE